MIISEDNLFKIAGHTVERFLTKDGIQVKTVLEFVGTTETSIENVFKKIFGFLLERP